MARPGPQVHSEHHEMKSIDNRPHNYAPDPLDLPVKLLLARMFHGISPASVGLAYADWFSHFASSPAHQAELAGSALRKSLLWMQYASQAWQGECPLCIDPSPNDRRFAPPEWHTPPFSMLAQGFLLNQQWWEEAMTGVRGVSSHHEDVVAFTIRQFLDMASPSNFIATNPQVLKETANSAGTNLVNGVANWARDAVAVMTDGRPRGVEAFEPGKGVALTPGKVVFRNALIELIQYEPATPDVAAEPLLIVPSWIMKYYILDLTPDDSLVRHLVGQGHTVFMVSWRNPGSEDRGLGMEDYLQQGVLAAIEAVKARRPRVRIHAAGYCLGGTLLAIAAALLGRREGNPLKTVSLLAGQVDFNHPGELGLFIDESQIAFLEGVMAERGYLDGRQMAGAFQLINSKDLVWSKLVHEYMMGAHTPMTPMKAWNADATRLPARMHSEYLRKLYLHNDLAEGRYAVEGRPVRLADIDVPLFVVATERDHVSPWKSVYKIHQLVHSPVTFALSSGGHNVGIVNPPAGPLAHPQASYRLAAHLPRQAPADPQEWEDVAAEHAGSWWPCWTEWLGKHQAGARIKPPVIEALRQHGDPLAAPGTYVFQR
ncbi:MAG TPA: alpha/beta fold hydrolase [Ramlibacter sp.]|nr:alpha/beta fold hydrolase [Ramlibacter sp.]